MAQSVGLGVFLEYDDSGKPFAGLELVTPISREQVFIGNIDALTQLITGLAQAKEELRKMKPRVNLVKADGVNSDALRTRQQG